MYNKYNESKTLLLADLFNYHHYWLLVDRDFNGDRT